MVRVTLPIDGSESTYREEAGKALDAPSGRKPREGRQSGWMSLH